MKHFKAVSKNYLFAIVALIFINIFVFSAKAEDFIIKDGETETELTIPGEDDTLTIEEGGSLESNTSGQSALSITGENVVITNFGTIATTKGNAFGILSRGTRGTITNNGIITTTELGAFGIRIQSDGSVITNNGDITTNGDLASIIFVDGQGNTITNFGNFITTGRDSHGIYSTNGNTITNDGNITTSGQNANGLYSKGAFSSITNNGEIALSGYLSDGIHSEGSSTIIFNTGEITTGGNKSYGIFSSGSNSFIDNSGFITITGTDSFGIAMQNENASITNTGEITMEGSKSYGIYSESANAIIFNTGGITTGGNESYGIFSSGSNSFIDNSGLITTTGDDSFGIAMLGDGSRVLHSGIIALAGDGLTGIASWGQDAIIDVSGSIFITGENSYAITGDRYANETLNLYLGHFIGGDIDLKYTDNIAEEDKPDVVGDDIVNIYLGSGGPSSTYKVAGWDKYNVYYDDGPNPKDGEDGEKGEDGVDGVDGQNGVDGVDGKDGEDGVDGVDGKDGNDVSDGEDGQASTIINNPPILIHGDRIYILDPTQQSAERIILGETTSQLHRLMFQQLGSTKNQKENLPWTTFFASNMDYNSEDMALAWGGSRFGGLLGYQIVLPSGQHLGFFAGGNSQSFETGITSIKSKSSSGFLGVYGQQVINNWDINGSFNIGFENHHSSRTVWDNLAGEETAEGDYNSLFASVAMELGYTHDLPAFQVRPSALVSYTHGSYGDYLETGTTNSNMNFKDRGVGIFESRLQLEAKKTINEKSTVKVHGGATFKNYGNDTASVSLEDSETIKYKLTGDKTVFGGYAGANVLYNVKDNINIVANTEYKWADMESISGSLRLLVRF